jgi:cytochrome b6-f complex iron-sulfur subunit
MRKRRQRIEQQLDALAHGERLPAGKVEDPDDLDALRVAIELRSTRLAADLPSDEFVAALQHRLAEERQPASPSQAGISRRTLLATAGAAAAAAAVGVVVDRTLLSGHEAARTNVAAHLAPNDGQWVAVDVTSAVSHETAQRFDTPSVVGFVSGQGDNLVAVSGTCTHLGCLLQPNPQAGRLDCPCHRTSFGYDGRVLFSQLDVPPPALPRIDVRQRNGTVEVLVPRQT